MVIYDFFIKNSTGIDRFCKIALFHVLVKLKSNNISRVGGLFRDLRTIH